MIVIILVLLLIFIGGGGFYYYKTSQPPTQIPPPPTQIPPPQAAPYTTPYAEPQTPPAPTAPYITPYAEPSPTAPYETPYAEPLTPPAPAAPYTTPYAEPQTPPPPTADYTTPYAPPPPMAPYVTPYAPPPPTAPYVTPYTEPQIEKEPDIVYVAPTTFSPEDDKIDIVAVKLNPIGGNCPCDSSGWCGPDGKCYETCSASGKCSAAAVPRKNIYYCNYDACKLSGVGGDCPCDPNIAFCGPDGTCYEICRDRGTCLADNVPRSTDDERICDYSNC